MPKRPASTPRKVLNHRAKLCHSAPGHGPCVGGALTAARVARPFPLPYRGIHICAIAANAAPKIGATTGTHA